MNILSAASLYFQTVRFLNFRILNNSSFFLFIPPLFNLYYFKGSTFNSMRTSGSSFLPDHNFLLMQRYNRPRKCCLYPSADLPRGKTFFPSKRRESNSFHYHATHRIRDWIPRIEFWLFSRRIHFNNANIIQIPVCFAFSFHFLHLFFSRSWQNSSTKRRGGHDMRFGRLPMFICDGETQYTIPLRTHCSIYTPCNDH